MASFSQLSSGRSSPDLLALPISDATSSPARPSRRVNLAGSPSRRPQRASKGTPNSIQIQDFYIPTPSRAAPSVRLGSPSRTIAQTNDLISPWRIRVRVEAEHEDAPQPGKRRRTGGGKGGMGGGRVLGTISPSPQKLFGANTRTMTVPLKTGEEESGVKRGRGRPRRSNGTPDPRAGTPKPGTKRRRSALEEPHENEEPDTASRTKRKRGRPRKSAVADGASGAQQQVPSSAAPSTGKARRGRRKTLGPVDIARDAGDDDADQPDLLGADVGLGIDVPRNDRSRARMATGPLQERSSISPQKGRPDRSLFGSARKGRRQDPTDAHSEFDSIMESEGFSLITLGSVPSAQQFHSRIHDDSEAELERSLSPVQADQVDALSSDFPEDHDFSAYNDENTHELDDHDELDQLEPQPTPSLLTRTAQFFGFRQKTPSVAATSPVAPASVPPAEPVEELPLPQDSNDGAPRMQRVFQAGRVLQDAISEERRLSTPRIQSRAIANVARDSSPKERLDDLFSGFGASARRELRANSRAGEDSAQRPNRSRRDDISMLDNVPSSNRATKEDKSQHRPDPMELDTPTDVHYPEIRTRQLPSPEDSLERNDPDEMSWRIDTPDRTATSAPQQRPKNATPAKLVQFRGAAKNIREQEAQWQTENQATVKAVRNPVSAQVADTSHKDAASAEVIDGIEEIDQWPEAPVLDDDFSEGDEDPLPPGPEYESDDGDGSPLPPGPEYDSDEDPVPILEDLNESSVHIPVELEEDGEGSVPVDIEVRDDPVDTRIAESEDESSSEETDEEPLPLEIDLEDEEEAEPPHADIGEADEEPTAAELQKSDHYEDESPQLAQEVESDEEEEASLPEVPEHDDSEEQGSSPPPAPTYESDEEAELDDRLPTALQHDQADEDTLPPMNERSIDQEAQDILAAIPSTPVAQIEPSAASTVNTEDSASDRNISPSTSESADEVVQEPQPELPIADEETVDIWQLEAESFSLNPQQLTPKASESTQTERLKPPRSKLPTPWRSQHDRQIIYSDDVDSTDLARAQARKSDGFAERSPQLQPHDQLNSRQLTPKQGKPQAVIAEPLIQPHIREELHPSPQVKAHERAAAPTPNQNKFKRQDASIAQQKRSRDSEASTQQKSRKNPRIEMPSAEPLALELIEIPDDVSDSEDDFEPEGVNTIRSSPPKRFTASVEKRVRSRLLGEESGDTTVRERLLERQRRWEQEHRLKQQAPVRPRLLAAPVIKPNAPKRYVAPQPLSSDVPDVAMATVEEEDEDEDEESAVSRELEVVSISEEVDEDEDEPSVLADACTQADISYPDLSHSQNTTIVSLTAPAFQPTLPSWLPSPHTLTTNVATTVTSTLTNLTILLPSLPRFSTNPAASSTRVTAQPTLSSTFRRAPSVAPSEPAPPLTAYLPWTVTHFRRLDKVYADGLAQPARYVPLARHGPAARLVGKKVRSCGWQKTLEEWECGVVEAFLTLLEEEGEWRETDAAPTVARGQIIDADEVARRLFGLWCGKIMRGRLELRDEKVGLWDESLVRHRGRQLRRQDRWRERNGVRKGFFW